MGHYLQIREGFPVKSALGCVIFCLLLTGLLAGCCGQPAQEIDAAKTAVDAAVSEGAEKFSPGEARKVGAELTAAMDEVNTQGNKVFRDYAKAKRMLLQVKSDADAMNAGLAAKKAAARKDAEGAFVAAKFAVERAGAALGKAPERIPVERESLAFRSAKADRHRGLSYRLRQCQGAEGKGIRGRQRDRTGDQKSCLEKGEEKVAGVQPALMKSSCGGLPQALKVSPNMVSRPAFNIE
jgi:hypothetical protein